MELISLISDIILPVVGRLSWNALLNIEQWISWGHSKTKRQIFLLLTFNLKNFAF